MPEAVHAAEGAGVGGEEIRPIGEYGEKEALGDGMAEKMSDDSTGGG